MTGTQERAAALLREQQSKVEDRSPQWMTAEQLMDICRMEPESAELIAQDLDNGLNITEAEKKIKAFADKHKTGNFACVTPKEADSILREYFGLPKAGKREHIVVRSSEKKAERKTDAPTVPARSLPPDGGVHVDLAAFLGG